MTDYYVYFGKQFWFITHIPYLDALVSILIGIILMCIFYYLHSRKKIKLKPLWLVLIPIIAMIVLFVALFLIFPTYIPKK